MIITRTPLRVSFFGGGSDMPAFYQRQSGAVLSTAVNQFMYLSCHRTFDGRSIRVKYSTTEDTLRVADLRHPIVRRVLERLGIPGGIEITSTADIPAGTGLGSSSSFTVGMLNLIYAWQGRQVSPGRLGREASEIEIHDLAQPIGKQDQYAAAFGGLNLIRFFPDETVDVSPLVISAETRAALESSFLLFYTGDQRAAHTVLSEQSRGLRLDPRRFEEMKRMVDQAFVGKTLLEAGDVVGFGRLLHDAWTIKRQQATTMSNERIDTMYQRAMDAGAWGGKLLGAGGGGFLLVAAPPERHAEIRARVEATQELPLRLERGGSKVVYMSEDEPRAPRSPESP